MVDNAEKASHRAVPWGGSVRGRFGRAGSAGPPPGGNGTTNARALEATSAIAFDGAHLWIACENNRDLGCELIKRFAQALIQRPQSTRRQYVESLRDGRFPSGGLLETPGRSSTA